MIITREFETTEHVTNPLAICDEKIIVEMIKSRHTGLFFEGFFIIRIHDDGYTIGETMMNTCDTTGSASVSVRFRATCLKFTEGEIIPCVRISRIWPSFIMANTLDNLAMVTIITDEYTASLQEGQYVSVRISRTESKHNAKNITLYCEFYRPKINKVGYFRILENKVRDVRRKDQKETPQVKSNAEINQMIKETNDTISHIKRADYIDINPDIFKNFERIYHGDASDPIGCKPITVEDMIKIEAGAIVRTSNKTNHLYPAMRMPEGSKVPDAEIIELPRAKAIGILLEEHHNQRKLMIESCKIYVGDELKKHENIWMIYKRQAETMK